MASLSAGREHPAVLSAAVGEDWSRQRVVMVGRRGLHRRAFSGCRCQDMLTDPHSPHSILPARNQCVDPSGETSARASNRAITEIDGGA